MQRILKFLIQSVACLALALPLVASAADMKIDPTGTWKSSFTNQNGDVRETVFKLKLEGDKLSGTVSGRNADTAIEQGKVTGQEISFQVTREFNDNKFVTKYTGKISGDTITGKSESVRNGEPQTRDWVAKREAPPKEPAAK